MGRFRLLIILFIINTFLGISVPAEPVWDGCLTHLANDDFYDIALNGNEVWCVARSAVIRYNRVTGNFVRYTMKDGLPDNIIHCVAVDNNGVIWFGSHKGLTSFDEGEWIIYPAEEIWIDERSRPAFHITNIFVDADNNLIIASENISKILYYDGEIFQPLMTGRARSITSDPEGNIWILDLHYEGIHKIDREDYSVATYKYPQDTSPFYALEYLFCDSLNNLWLGTWDRGVFFISLNQYHANDWDKWNSYYNLDKHSPQSVESIIEDPFGNIWFTDGIDLLQYDRFGNWIHYDSHEQLPGSIQDIAADEYGRIWMGTNDGLFSMTPDYVTAVFDAPPAPLDLDPPHPNPFNPQTTLSFTLPAAGFARLAVYNLGGQLVRELAAETLPAGRHEIVWDGRDADGARVASGIYIVRLAAGGRSAVRKVTLVR